MMEPTDCSTPPPPPPPAGTNKRQRKAVLPLGDVTNLLPNTPTPRNPSTRRKAALPLGDGTNLLPKTPTLRNPSTRRPVPTLSDASPSVCSSTSVMPVSKASPAADAEENSLDKSAISTVYKRRKPESRKRGPASVKAPFPAGTATSCPPLGRASRAGSHSTRKTPVAMGSQAISSSAPCHQTKKMRNTGMASSSSGKLKLPEDFVKKQRAYFKEVDAFELPEEEASD